MKKLELFRRQFLLTIHENFDLPWCERKIQNFNLYYHPDLEFEHSKNGRIELILLGFLFDYDHPEYSNKNILDSLSLTSSFEDFLENLSKYSGHYVIFYAENSNLILLNDACAQLEIYYDTSFSSFGSQPKLLGKVIKLRPYTLYEPIEYYQSTNFLSNNLFIGETTHIDNVKHLLPNHYIDIELKSIIRYFPRKKIQPISINEASIIACKMLKGYIKAASLRNKLYMGVTGGYDSRILFLASLEIDCKYYVSKLNDMTDRHYDIVIPQKLTEIYKKKFRIISEIPISREESEVQEMSIDFPRRINKTFGEYFNHVLINGNLSEIARNYYGYHKNISPNGLALLYLHCENKFVSTEYNKWLNKSSRLFLENGYDILDMFYWEEKMGNWAAKAKTEMGACGTVLYSPFCSHSLLTILLSTPRKDRDSHFNKLYNQMITDFSSESDKIPINPSLKKNLIILMKKLRIFNLIQQIIFKNKLKNH